MYSYKYLITNFKNNIVDLENYLFTPFSFLKLWSFCLIICQPINILYIFIITKPNSHYKFDIL